MNSRSIERFFEFTPVCSGFLGGEYVNTFQRKIGLNFITQIFSIENKINARFFFTFSLSLILFRHHLYCNFSLSNAKMKSISDFYGNLGHQQRTEKVNNGKSAQQLQREIFRILSI